MNDINITIHQQGEKTAELICNYCGEVHAVEPEYREETLRKGIGAAAEFELQTGIKVAPDQTWTCGRCLLVLSGYPPDYMKTDCHDHEVPKERVVK